jgi:hypothetical protein
MSTTKEPRERPLIDIESYELPGDMPVDPLDAHHQMDLFGEERPTDYEMVEYAPGKYAAAFGADPVPRYGVVRFERVGKSEFRPRFVGWGRHVGVRKFFRPSATGREPHPVLQSLGLDLCYNSILRLYKNGFISGSMPVPGRILIDLESLARHIQETRDPDYWTAERRQRYNETIY